MSSKSQVGIVILAAGESKRLGQPKQLLPYVGTTVISHIVKTALASNANQTIVIAGAHIELIRNELDSFPAIIVENRSWQEGVATSIRLAVETLEQSNMATRAVLFMTSDQPHVSTVLINTIIDKFDNQDNRIVACEYEKTVGIPALFGHSYFPELNSLEGDHGAKGIIMNHHNCLLTVPFPEGGLDIDTAEDVEKLRHLYL